MSSLTRRTFLAVATATLGAVAVARRRAGPDDRSAPGGDQEDDGHDVAAGLAGFTAARQMVVDGLDVVWPACGPPPTWSPLAASWSA